MKKVLMMASVASMISQFNMNNIHILQELGCEVHVACNFCEGSTCDNDSISELKSILRKNNIMFFQIDFSRKISNLRENIRAYQEVKVLLQREKYLFVHCHSPIGGVVGRLAGHATKTKVIYTAHGFHFYKGAPLKNWILYYPVEKKLSKYTDTLITINSEDYHRALKFKAKHVEYVPGVGIDSKKNFSYAEIRKNKNEFQSEYKKRQTFREELGIPENSYILLSVGELNKNKNHELVIRALVELEQENIYYLICGQGNLQTYLNNLAQKYKLEDRVKLLGYVKNVNKFYECADVFCFMSKREGLGMAALEAMSSGLPLITSNIHGINDYSIPNVTGFSCSPNDFKALARHIKYLIDNPDLRYKMGIENQQLVKRFDISVVSQKMKHIYENSL